MSVIELAVISYGVVIGVFLRRALPDHHLADEAKDVVRLGTGRIGTTAALDPMVIWLAIIFMTFSLFSP